MTATTGTIRPARAPRPRAVAPGVDPVDADIDLACRTLQLPTIREQYGEIAATALREQASYTRFLANLLAAEVAERLQRRKLRLVHEAGFARPKRLEDFDFAANPAVSAEVIATLADPAWARAGQPLILLGDSGTGKSHLLIGIGTAIAEAGLKVRYSTCANLVNELVEAADEHRLSRTITRFGKVDLLCLDEFGYLELDPAGAKLLFQIFTEREERRAIAVASNAPFSEWSRTFTDPRLCSAIVDRLTFNGHIIETGTDSYRLATTRAKRRPR
jgi:DNA replication protein DnaC